MILSEVIVTSHILVKRSLLSLKVNKIYSFQHRPAESEVDIHTEDSLSSSAYTWLSILSCFCSPILAFLAIWFSIKLSDARRTGNKIAMMERSRLVKLFVCSSLGVGVVTYTILIYSLIPWSKF